MSFLNQPKGPQHWHITTARKPPGECVRCDLERAAETTEKHAPENRHPPGTG